MRKVRGASPRNNDWQMVEWTRSSARPGASAEIALGRGLLLVPRRREERTTTSSRRERARSSVCEELVDRDRASSVSKFELAACAELDRDPRDRGGVGRLDDVDEVEGAEGRPLMQHLGAELLDVAVDLAQAVRIGLERLDPLGAQGRASRRSASGLLSIVPSRVGMYNGQACGLVEIEHRRPDEEERREHEIGEEGRRRPQPGHRCRATGG